jgi:hypothetical protein
MQVCQGDNPPPFVMGEGHFSRCWLQHPQMEREIEGLYRAVAVQEAGA